MSLLSYSHPENGWRRLEGEDVSADAGTGGYQGVRYSHLLIYPVYHRKQSIVYRRSPTIVIIPDFPGEKRGNMDG